LDVNIGSDTLGEYLRLKLRRPLRKTPRNGSLPKHLKCSTILRRTPKCFDWESDFAGWLLLDDGRRYRVGTYVFGNQDCDQVLKIYFRLQLHAARLEVVK
jgi:hypothetical protein